MKIAELYCLFKEDIYGNYGSNKKKLSPNLKDFLLNLSLLQ